MLEESSGIKRAAYFRKRLMERYHYLLQESQRNIEGFDYERDPRRNPTPRIVVDTYAEEVTHQVSEMRLGELQEIEEALRRIPQGEYGVCEDCGACIPAARLRAIPSALFCVECQEKREWRQHVERARDQGADGAYASLASAMAQMTID